MLSQQEALLTQLWSGLTQTEDTSDARIRLEADLSKIQNSLPQMADLPLKGQVLIEGKLNSPAQARWPEDLIGDLTATLTTRKSVISEHVGAARRVRFPSDAQQQTTTECLVGNPCQLQPQSEPTLTVRSATGKPPRRAAADRHCAL